MSVPSSDSESNWIRKLEKSCNEDIEYLFTIGGKTTPREPMTLLFKQKDGSWSEIMLDGKEMNEAQMLPLLDACEPASFGKGLKKVLDPSVRQAFALDKKQFSLLNFRIEDFQILNEIKAILSPNSENIVAELYKLNFYGPNGFFAPHVDTPRASDMFGSLVVCLPSTFTGGVLKVCKSYKSVNDTEHEENILNREFQWGLPEKAVSNSGAEMKTQFQWAAFYSDCEHEIFPVETGYRITVTYNLYTSKIGSRAPTEFPNDSLPFLKELKIALQNETFYPDGGVLGFALRHAYPTNDKPCYLKGSDWIMQEALKKVSLSTQIVPVFKPTECNGYVGHSEHDHDLVVVGSWDAIPDLGETYDHENYYGGATEYLLHVFRDAPCVDQWITCPSQFRIPAICADYGNEPGTSTFYAAAALLAIVPPFSVRQRKH